MRTWERLVSSGMAQVPVGWDTSDVAARRIQNWVYAWQEIAASPSYSGLRDGLDERLLESIGEQAAYVHATLDMDRIASGEGRELYAVQGVKASTVRAAR